MHLEGTNMKSTDTPRIFISYSWDSENHKANVAEFVSQLRSNGIEVIYDGDLELGERLPRFMENSIAKSDFVLYICTPNYKYKADNRVSGVGYENNIITSELYETQDERKFIPILFAGTWSELLPIWSKGKLGIDLTISPSSEFERLLRTIQKAGTSTTSFVNIPSVKTDVDTISGVKKRKPKAKRTWAVIGALSSLITIFAFLFGKNFPDIIQSMKQSFNTSTFLLMSESSYLSEIKRVAGPKSYIFYHYYTDYNGDGNCELFAFVTTIDEYRAYCDKKDEWVDLNVDVPCELNGDIWFVNQNGAVIVEQDFRCGDVRLPFLVDNMTFIAFKEYYVTSMPTYLWGVTAEGKPYQPNLSGKGNDIFINDYYEIELSCSAYDFSSNKVGHTWTSYYFYWDDTNFKG